MELTTFYLGINDLKIEGLCFSFKFNRIVLKKGVGKKVLLLKYLFNIDRVFLNNILAHGT